MKSDQWILQSPKKKKKNYLPGQRNLNKQTKKIAVNWFDLEKFFNEIPSEKKKTLKRSIKRNDEKQACQGTNRLVSSAGLGTGAQIT